MYFFYKYCRVGHVHVQTNAIYLHTVIIAEEKPWAEFLIGLQSNAGKIWNHMYIISIL